MNVSQPISTALHILVGHKNVVGWRLVLIYTRTPPTHYYPKSNGQASYIDLHGNLPLVHLIPLGGFCLVFPTTWQAGGGSRGSYEVVGSFLGVRWRLEA